jgi:cardiolipin synthase (CMP-forming)
LLRHLPNALTVLRILLVGPVVWFLLHGDYRSTLIGFAIAAVTDALDGLLAKRFGWTSELGKVLDPLADKLLLVAMFITLGVLGFAPVWLTVLVVARDVVIAGGALLFHLSFGALGGRPTPVSKLNTLCQILFVLAVIGQAAGLGVAEPVVTSFGALVMVTTVVSGLDYVLRYASRALALKRERTAS